MSVEYMRRFATGLGQYEFAEVRSDQFEEFVEGAANLADYVSSNGGEVTPAQAEQNVKKAFGKTTEVKSSGGFGNKSGGFSSQQSLPDSIELGEHEGYKISVYTKGKYGPCFNAYQKGASPEKWYADLPKGADPAKVTLQDAIEALAEKYPGGK